MRKKTQDRLTKIEERLATKYPHWLYVAYVLDVSGQDRDFAVCLQGQQF